MQRMRRLDRMAQPRLQRERATLPVRPGGQRHAAAAAQRTRHRALGMHRQPGRRVGQRFQRLAQRGRIGAHLQAQRALPGRRQHHVRIDHRADARVQAQPLQARGGQHDAVVLALVELAQPGVEVAPQRLHIQVRPDRLELHHPAQARGADPRALRQRLHRLETGRDPGIARVLALQHGAQREALGHLHRHVLERVHRQVSAALLQRDFQLLDEQALAADLRQRAVQDLVTLRRHAQQLDAPAEALAQQGLDMLGLPQGQAAFAGGDDARGRQCVHAVIVLHRLTKS